MRGVARDVVKLQELLEIGAALVSGVRYAMLTVLFTLLTAKIASRDVVGWPAKFKMIVSLAVLLVPMEIE